MREKIATMDGVHEYGEGDPVEIWNDGGGHIVIRAYSECGNSYTDVDLVLLLGWIRLHVKRGNPIGEKIMALMPELERQYSV